MTLAIQDWQQVIKNVYDNDKEALRITGAVAAPASEPADSTIQNNEVVFWVNGSNELIAKHKDNGGTVRSLTIGTLT